MARRRAGSDKFGGIALDSLINAAGQALAAGDPLAALKFVALREDAPALALRGIAMAQLGAFDEARALLRRAARGFGPGEEVARARCVVAGAEIALAARDLAPTVPLAAARAVLERHGEPANAAFARLVDARRMLLIGRLDAAGEELAALVPDTLPPPLAAVRALVAAGIAMRRLHAGEARTALARARLAAREAAIPALVAEVEAAWASLSAPAAQLISGGTTETLRLDEVEALRRSPALIVDACRFEVRRGAMSVALARRPVLFALARTLAEAGPDGAAREALLLRAFRARHADESHRARLRVEIGRLRLALRPLATIAATPHGFALSGAPEVRVLAPLVADRHAAALALLADGEAWSSSALALAMGSSQRQAQRALEALARAGKVEAFGRGRARRWTTPPLPGIATALLLPAPMAPG